MAQRSCCDVKPSNRRETLLPAAKKASGRTNESRLNGPSSWDGTSAHVACGRYTCRQLINHIRADSRASAHCCSQARGRSADKPGGVDPLSPSDMNEEAVDSQAQCIVQMQAGLPQAAVVVLTSDRKESPLQHDVETDMACCICIFGVSIS